MKSKIADVLIFATAMLLFVAQNGAAQPTGLDNFLTKWQEKGLSVRQTFDGTKNEQNPANISYVDPTYVIDLGIKFVDWQPFADSAKHSIVLSPIVEWHRANTPKKVNATSGKISIEYAYGNLQLFDFSGKPLNEPGTGDRIWGPLISLKGGVKRDELLNTSSDEASVNVTVVSNKPNWPNAKNVDSQQHETYLWSPSIGAEVYGDTVVRDPEEIKGVDVTMLRARLYVVVYPWNRDGNRRNEASIEFTQRWRTGGQETLGDSHFFTIQLTRFLDVKRRVGIGIGYDDGRDPNVQFLPISRTSIGLKINL